MQQGPPCCNGDRPPVYPQIQTEKHKNDTLKDVNEEEEDCCGHGPTANSDNFCGLLHSTTVATTLPTPFACNNHSSSTLQQQDVCLWSIRYQEPERASVMTCVFFSMSCTRTFLSATTRSVGAWIARYTIPPAPRPNCSRWIIWFAIMMADFDDSNFSDIASDTRRRPRRGELRLA